MELRQLGARNILQELNAIFYDVFTESKLSLCSCAIGKEIAQSRGATELQIFRKEQQVHSVIGAYMCSAAFTYFVFMLYLVTVANPAVQWEAQ